MIFLTIIALKPLAPVFLSIASFAMALRASGVNVRSTLSIPTIKKLINGYSLESKERNNRTEELYQIAFDIEAPWHCVAQLVCVLTTVG